MNRENWVILALVVALGASTPTRSDSQAALTETLDDFHRAAASADTERYFAALTDNVVFLGTDGSERWQGQDFRDFVQSHFESGRGWTYEPLKRRIVMGPGGATAWFDEALRNEGLGLCRGSGVLVKSGTQWKIAQYNLSVPVPNAMVYAVAADIAALSNGTASQGQPPPAPESSASTGSALAVEPSGTESAEAEPQTSQADCKRKRFKTNRKAGC